MGAGLSCSYIQPPTTWNSVLIAYLGNYFSAIHSTWNQMFVEIVNLPPPLPKYCLGQNGGFWVFGVQYKCTAKNYSKLDL